jgi:hypothetical protein
LHKDGYAGWRSTYDVRGNKLEVTYFGLNERRTLNKEDRIAGWRAKFDERDNEIETVFFGLDGRPAPGKAGGFASRRTTFDVFGNPLDRTYHDPSGARTARKDGAGVVSLWRRRYDAYSRMSEESFFDTRDQPVNNDKGAHRITYTHDRFGTVTATRLFDVAGREIGAAAGRPGKGRGPAARKVIAAGSPPGG